MGLVGVGSIGAHLAATARHFGLTVRGYTRSSADCVHVSRYFHPGDEAAFAAHEEQPHVRRFLSAREPMLESVRVERLRGLDGPLTRAAEPGVRA